MRDLFQPIALKMSKRVPLHECLPAICDLLSYLRCNSTVELSAWHPLGFVLFKLGSVEGLGSLRLHVWPDKDRRPQYPYWSIHNHMWDLNSHILCGAATNEIYDIKQSEGNHQFYRVSYEGNNSILERTGRRLACQLGSSITYGRGEYYVVEGDIYHATKVAAETFTATLVLTTEAKKAAPTVVGDWNGNSKYIYARRMCNRREFSKLLDQVLSQI